MNRRLPPGAAEPSITTLRPMASTSGRRQRRACPGRFQPGESAARPRGARAPSCCGRSVGGGWTHPRSATGRRSSSRSPCRRCRSWYSASRVSGAIAAFVPPDALPACCRAGPRWRCPSRRRPAWPCPAANAARCRSPGASSPAASHRRPRSRSCSPRRRSTRSCWWRLRWRFPGNPRWCSPGSSPACSRRSRSGGCGSPVGRRAGRAGRRARTTSGRPAVGDVRGHRAARLPPRRRLPGRRRGGCGDVADPRAAVDRSTRGRRRAALDPCPGRAGRSCWRSARKPTPSSPPG